MRRLVAAAASLSLMRILRFGAVLCVGAAISSVCVTAGSAQEQPPPGYPARGCDYDQRGNYYCWGGTTTTPTPADKWAAVAVSPSTLRSGASRGQNSEAEAKRLALRTCATMASDCEVANSGNNLCFALATSQPDGTYGQDFDSGRVQAERKALARCRGAGGKNCIAQTSPCASDAPRWPSPAAPAGHATDVDPHTIGTWQLSMSGGRWLWEVARDGTYKFHSEAADGVAPHAGTFSASAGHWSLRATNGYADCGTYTFQPPGTLIATGYLGAAAWQHPANALHN